MNAIVTVTGIDRVGIIAGVSAALANSGVNILDISQTVMQDYFTMVMLVDTAASKVEFSELKASLAEVGNTIGMSIRIQREDIFQSMHRV